MKPNIVDLLTRGFVAAAANWEMIALRMVEVVLSSMGLGATAIAVILPGVFLFPWKAVVGAASGGNAEQAIEAIRPMLRLLLPWLVYAVFMVLLALTALMALHSFFVAASASIYNDSSQLAPGESRPSTNAVASFSMPRWLDAGREGWRRVFWIYNIVWSVAALVLFVPLALVALAFAQALFHESSLGIIGGCAVLAFTVMLAIPTSIISTAVSMQAVYEGLRMKTTARVATARGWLRVRSDAVRTVGLTCVLIVASIALASLFGGFSTLLSLSSRSATGLLLLMPVRVAISCASIVISCGTSAWMLASFAGFEPLTDSAT